jgi:hypothetical protein
MFSRLLASLFVSLAVSAHAGASLSFGTGSSVLERIVSEKAGIGSVFSLPMPDGAALELKVEDFDFSGGDLSMAGSVSGSAGSEFILKGTASDLYGWAALRAEKRAYEFTNLASGLLQVEEVPFTKIYSVCDLDDAADTRPAPPPEPIQPGFAAVAGPRRRSGTSGKGSLPASPCTT